MNRKKELHLSSIKSFEPKINIRKRYFSEINNWFNNTTRKGTPVKQYLNIEELRNTLNNVSSNTPKDKAPAILKGIYKEGTAGEYAEGGTPFLFYDIDAKDNKNWAYDKAKNASVFDTIKRYSVLTWRSNSGNGIAGLIYCEAFKDLDNSQKGFHNQLAEITYTHLKKIIYSETEKIVNFDPAQGKFRQVRFLAHQRNKAEINLNPICFDIDYKIKKANYDNGLPKFQFMGDVVGSIQHQFNNNNRIEDILRSNGYDILSNGRVKSPTTSATSSGEIKDNRLRNYSSSSGKRTSYTPYYFVLEHQYTDNAEAFISDLKKQGYNNIRPKKETLSDKLKTAKTNIEINHACRHYKHLKYQDKIDIVSKLKGQKREAVSTYLGLKSLELKPNIEYKVKEYVSEVVEDIFNDLDKHNKIILKAETGIGKTTAILREFARIRPNKRVLICVPLVSIAKQIASEYANVTALTEGSDLDEHYKARKNNIVVATYENAGNHLRNKNLFDYIVIDEAHNLFNANSYKSKTISKLALLIEDKKVLGLTATPNGLFQKLGYKLANVVSNNTKTELIQRIYKRGLEKVIIDHVRASKRKLIIRVNSKQKLKHIKEYLIKNDGYNDDEILFLHSTSDIKESDDFRRLTNQGTFRDSVKIVLTTSVIDEGLSIRQDGFDTLFIENNYFLSPESIKQFSARFRNQDDERKNYYYILKKENQSFQNISLNKCFNFFELDDIDDFSKYKSVLNQNIKYLENYSQSPWYRGNESFNLFISKLNLKEYNFYIQSNFNLKIIRDQDYNQNEVVQKEIKESILRDKEYYNDLWVNSRGHVLKVIEDTDKCLNTEMIDKTGIQDEDVELFYKFVIFNISDYKKLDYYYFQLRKYYKNPDEVMIKNGKVVYSTKIQNEIAYQETISLLQTNDKILNKTDYKHKVILHNIFDSISNKNEFSKDYLMGAWKKHTKVKYNHPVILRVIKRYFKISYNKRLKFFNAFPNDLFHEFEETKYNVSKKIA